MADSTSSELVAIRRNVPNDHSCLFSALAYLAEDGQNSCGKAKVRELRAICADEALADPDPGTKALLLGMNDVQEYAAWIKNEFHWGGENEIMVLAKHYGLEVAVICCNPFNVLCYGSDNPECNGRVHLLYTGQHYDALVGGATADALPSAEQRRFQKGWTGLEAAALEIAKKHVEDVEKRASQRRAKRIKCGGCGAYLTDTEAFATHCSEVEHGDDFAYDCEEVEIVIEGGESLPEGMIDLADSSKVHGFYATETEPFALAYASPVEIDGKRYPTLEHYWLCTPFIGRNDELVGLVAAAPTVAEAAVIANGAGIDAARPDWRDCRESFLIGAIRAKFNQHSDLATQLLATGDRTIVLVGTDPWAGMQAPGGIPSGQNHLGKALMEVRKELSAAKAGIEA
eukprot:TRINITY_DN17789_c0_g1_i1.p1 TRINITY_DN17789_c0_g1~~TRINITY_DN17789_c0_g1_i1.p1  ORF type:complete len:428 (-),score=85.09 TRINITY_DN17789_c0_g1_i1:324-1523(-)